MKASVVLQSFHRSFVFFLLFFLGGGDGTHTHSVWGQVHRPEIRQISTHPSMDFSPSVSPDGQWLAFVTERSGNLDVWVKPLPRGRAVQVTIHQSEDTQPVWSPNGRELAFVSKRRDAQGDVWLVSLDLSKGGIPKGRPEQLTQYLGKDSNPAFTPDGREILFDSDRDGQINLYSMALDTRRPIRLTLSGGMDPSHAPVGDWILFTSFRIHPEGDLFIMDMKQPEEGDSNSPKVFPITYGPSLDGQGAWSPDGRTVVFLRYDRDTDGDGKITPQDNGSLWQKQLVMDGEVAPARISVGRNEIQITTEIFHDADPVWSSQNEILFTSLRGKTKDVWTIPSGGLFPRVQNAQDQYAQVIDVYAEAVTREALLQSVLGYQRVQDYFPGDSLWVSRSLLHIGETFQLLNEKKRAETVLETLIETYSAQKREAALAELKLAIITEKSIEFRIDQCLRIIQSFPEAASALAETYILLGDLYREVGDIENSLAAYSRVIQSFPGLPNFRAQAQIKIGELLEQEGQVETSKQSYFSVIREFGEVPLWRQRASDRLIHQIQGSPMDRIRGLQQIINEVSDLHSFTAEAQLAIGRILMEQGQYEQAIRELEQTGTLVRDLRWAQAESMILRARAYGEIGSDLQGIGLLEEIIDSFGDVEGGRFVLEATETLFQLLFDSAERLKDQLDFVYAEARYRKALTLKPDHIPVHRGLVESVYNQRNVQKIEALIQEYEQSLLERPRDPVLLYGLGLALSYYGENRPEDLQRSNIILIQALSEDYRLIYPYRTLGFNYERLEKLEEEKARQTPSLFIRIGRTLIAPLRWLVGLLPLKGEEKKEGYYEKAIDALITAIELNDEKQDPRMEALLAQNLANNFYNLGEYGYKNAYRYYQMRLSLDTTFTQLLEKAIFYERTGHCGLVVEDTDYAGDYLLTAIRVYNDLGQKRDALRNSKMLAFLHQTAERYEEAIEVYEEAVIQDARTRSWDEVQRGFRNIAYNYHLMGEPEDALAYARRAERLLSGKKIPMKPPEKSALRVEIFGFSIPVWGMEDIGGASAEGFTLADEAAFIYALMSKSLESTKSYAEAIQYEMKRLEIFQKRKDRLAERISLNQLGSLYFKMADYDKAWEYFMLSWEQNKKRKDERGRWINSVNLGHVAATELTLLKQQKYTAPAQACMQEELDRIRANESSQLIREEMVLVSMLGTLWSLRAKLDMEVASDIEAEIRETLQRVDELKTAESYFREGLRLAREGGFWKEEAVLLKNLAEVAEYFQDDHSASALLQESYHIFQEKGEEGPLWRVMYSMAKLESSATPDSSSSAETRGNTMASYLQAMEQLEGVPIREEGAEERLSDRGERWSLYIDAAFELAGMGLYREALETVERGRRKQVTDLLARRPPQLKRERHKIVWGNLRYLQLRLQELRERMLEVETGPEARRRLRELRREKERYEKEYQEELAHTREEGDVLAYFTGVEPVDLGRVQAVLPEDGAALCYAMGGQKTSIWVVDGDTLTWTEIDIGEDQLRKRVKAFSRCIMRDSLYQEMSRELYDILIAPVADRIDARSRLIIVPDGFLWDVPFEALSSGDGILLESASIVYAPSLMTYRFAWDRKRINQDQGLLMGDVLDQPFQAAMARAVNGPNTILGTQATEDAFRELAPSAGILQLERWMVTNEEDPLLSTLVFSPGEKEDGFFQVKDLFSWDLRASLIFLPPPLSGRYRGIQGPLSFFHGLLYTGVPTVATSRWYVPREVKQVFYDTFYSNITESSFADALMEAQLTVRDRYPEPRHWAGFQIIGFGGLNVQEKIVYANENLMTTVNKGFAYEQREEFIDAAQTYEKARDMAHALGDSNLANRVEQLIIRASEKGALYGKAVAFQTFLREDAERRGDRDALLASMGKLVELYLQDGQYAQAAQTKQEYVRTIEEDGVTQDVVAAYEELAFIFALGRRYEDAVQWIDRYIQHYQTSADTLGLARGLIRKGRFQLEGDDYWAARPNLLEGLSLLEAYLKTSEANGQAKVELAAGYQLLGLTSEKLARYDEALAYQEKGLARFDELGLSDQVAQGHQYLANIHWERGDYRNALSHQNVALENFESLGNRKLLAVAYSTQGLIYMSLGDNIQARKAEEKALGMVEEDESLADQATILKNMGLVSIQEDDFESAYNDFYRASQIDSSLGYRRGLAYDYLNLGILSMRMGQPEESLSLLREGLRLSREIGNSRNEVKCLYRLGQAYHELGDEKMAIAVLDTGVTLASRLVVPEDHWRIVRQRGRVYADMDRDEEALTDYQAAVDIVEGLRAELKVEAFKQGFLDNKMDLYADIVRHLLEMKRDKEAFDFVERAKSRNFIDLLGNQDLTLARAQGEFLEQERAARLAVQEAQELLAALEGRGEPVTQTEKDERNLWLETLEQRRKDYTDILTTIQAESPELASFVSVDPWSTEEIQALLPDSTAIVEYFLTQDALFCWALFSDRIESRRVDVQREVLAESVRKLRETIQAYLSADIEGRELYGWLIAPLEKTLRSANHVVFVPHGILHYLPFGALQDEAGQYLIEKVSISLVPSTTVLGYCMEKQDALGTRESEPSVLALSNPDLGDPIYDLPFAEKEVLALRRSFGEVAAYFGSEVTESVVREEAGEHTVIHFACHGVYEPEAPLFSALLLSKAGDDDGRLEAHEIFSLKLNCELVVLSACETGLAQITRGDEIIGLARSFIFSGAPSILTSLWKVDDLATAVMVKRFYRFLQSGYPRAEALRRAQLLVKDGVNSHPAAWAAFGLTGDFR